MVAREVRAVTTCCNRRPDRPEARRGMLGGAWATRAPPMLRLGSKCDTYDTATYPSACHTSDRSHWLRRCSRHARNRTPSSRSTAVPIRNRDMMGAPGCRESAEDEACVVADFPRESSDL